ncbi:hypothetical protein MIND_00247700 [Mycena indigotica]|uniref:Uncharacterized protein n=1 Tax=Mycena indigotica TaxID=2126181 RepID=A0A8H6WDC3_9AGAR|nr:uncharacterized protein MIND_00247700 [Mycena indigotica]KAF7312346.1 hypothetical protein MIND_00247700 [Mycena indigotica]
MLGCWRRPAGPAIQLGRLFRPHSTSITPISSLTALHAFLAPTNLASKTPAISYTAKDLHKLYLDVKSLPPRRKGHPLNTYELNELLALFGTLSIRPPRQKCTYLHQFASHLRPSPFRTYWALVLELAQEIRVRTPRQPLTGTHHYWVMRAFLSRASSTPKTPRDPLDEATSYYLRIRNTPDSEVHIPYLYTMLKLRRHTHLPQTVRLLCRALTRHPFPNRRLVNLLWEVVLGDSRLVTAELQEMILLSISTRLTSIPKPLQTQSVKTTTLTRLADALTMQVFPCYHVPLPTVVTQWTATIAKEAFDPSLPIASRWINLTLLALHASPATIPHDASDGHDGKAHPVLSTILGLVTLERSIQPNQGERVRGTLRHIWLEWKTVVQVPRTVRGAVMAAFFHLAGQTYDKRLVEVCRQYCLSHSLWNSAPLAVLVNYAHAMLSTRMLRWDDLFDSIPVERQASVAGSLLESLVNLDMNTAQGLFAFCQHNNIATSGRFVHTLGLVVARTYFPSQAIALLRDKTLSSDQLEDLFNRIMGTLRREAHPSRDIPLANELWWTLKKLYIDSERTPHDNVKFSIRYALVILADSNYPVQASVLLKALYKRQPSFFSSHYFLRMMRVLVKRRRVAAVSLLEPMRSFPLLTRLNFRRKLALRLAQTGAHTLAGYAWRSGGKIGQRRSGRELLARAVRFRVNIRDGRPLRPWAGRIMAILRRRFKEPKTVEFGVFLLTRIGRIRDAKRILEEVQASGLDSSTTTRLGNAILNGALHRSKSKNARLVRHVLNNREQLHKSVGFRADRVTVNIIVKVLLRWPRYMDTQHIRRLFDHMIRMGYPAPGGPPFHTRGSPPSAVVALELPPFISFERHVVPLYKMFIKALHLQGDAEGAGMVVGILQATHMTVITSPQSASMSNKRKLADAFTALDNAVDPPPAAKRQNTTSRSLYATLAKYGVKSKPSTTPSSLRKSTPHLTAVLARAAARTRKVFPFASTSQPLPPTAEYRPSSVSSFLARLATFKIATYSLKPAQIDAVAAAKCGWTNDGKDRLVCGLCGVSWVVAARDGMSKEAANALVEKQRASLVDSHKNGCPWKTRQCDPSIYRVPLQAPSAMIRDLKKNAVVLDPIMQQIEVQHPLSASQLEALRSAVHEFKTITLDDDEGISEQTYSDDEKPSDTALLTALFGWTPTPPSSEQRFPSISRPMSRASSPFPSTPIRPSLAKLPSTLTPAATPGISSTPPSTPPRQFLRRMSGSISFASPKREVSTLHCELCQRRIGLWAFAPQPEPPSTPPPANARPPPPRRQLDLHKEHRSFCPYVVRSTQLASLPSADATPSSSPTEGVVEGWRAVLNIIRRYGSVQRQRTASLRRKQGLAPMDVDGDAIDNVEAMMTTVKKQGGQNLLSYVKGLLG